MQRVSSQIVGSYVGLSSATAYSRLLLSSQRMQRVSVYRYRSPPSLQNRITLSPVEKGLIDYALELRSTTHLPFWNAVFLACILGEVCTSQLVSAAFFHNGPGEAAHFDRDAVQAGALEELVISGAANVGLSSEVRNIDGGVQHLALLDFHCDISPHNEELAALVCSHLMPNGYILIDSGDSYHACGLELLTPEERTVFLGKALLAAPIVDSHYIAHQLQQDASTIRISNGGKALREPLVVREWVPERGQTGSEPPLVAAHP